MRVIWDIFIGDVRSLFRNVIAAIVVMGLALVLPAGRRAMAAAREVSAAGRLGAG